MKPPCHQIDRFRIKSVTQQGSGSFQGPVNSEPFVRRIPLFWVEAAGQLPGKALFIGVLLWREAGCSRSLTVRFRPAQFNGYEFDISAAKRGLRALERAGLVRIERRTGRCSLVTLIESPAQPTAANTPHDSIAATPEK